MRAGPCGALVSRHGSDVVGCAQPSERSARRIAQPIPSVLSSDPAPRFASMASADRQMVGGATLDPLPFVHTCVSQVAAPFLQAGQKLGKLLGLRFVLVVEFRKPLLNDIG